MKLRSNDGSNILTAVFIDNFQSIRQPTLINLEKLTFLYGPNSAGKSSILDAINLVKDLTDLERGTLSLEELLRRYVRDHSKQMRIGVEIIMGKLYGYANPKVENWLNATAPGIDDRFHTDLIDKLNNRRLQLEVGLDNEIFISLRVAVDGSPLFALENSERVDASEILGLEDILDDLPTGGRLIFYKDNPIWKEFPITSDLRGVDYQKRKNYFNISLLAEETSLVLENEKTLELWGYEILGFDSRFAVEFGPLIELMRNGTAISKSEAIALCGVRKGSFFYDYFCKKSRQYKSTARQRESFLSSSWDLRDSINLFIRGIFLCIDKAIDFSVVRGDRGLINSKVACSLPHEPPFQAEKIDEHWREHDHIVYYANYLAEHRGLPRKTLSSKYISSHVKYDFVNRSITNHLESLQGYEIIAQVHRVKSPAIGIFRRAKESEYAHGDMVFLKIRNRDGKILDFVDVGSGFSYILPILTALWRSGLCFIEQPELHLHPKLQCEIGDVFIESINQRSSVVIETHSEHILLRILRRIREAAKEQGLPSGSIIRPEDIKIYYFEPNSDGGTDVRCIRVDRRGDLLDLWPGGFFSERELELFS